MKEQQIVVINDNYMELDELFKDKTNDILLVCDGSFKYLEIANYFMELESRQGNRVIIFDRFQPNPLYDSVVEGVKKFRDEKCRMIVAVGGGSAMDVAKCIKLYANMPSGEFYLKREIIPNSIPLVAVPTTAGTGSESTRFAVVYHNGEKQSICHESCIPDYVVFDSSTLKSLPEYHRKSTMLDALCHSLESLWSVNATEESRKYSKEALEKILRFKESYLANDDDGNLGMLKAANTAGKAINIAQTTAGHAMSYKITSLFHIAHGHAAALCVSKVWRYMVDNAGKCIDTAGKERLESIFKEIADVMGAETAVEAVDMFDEFVASLELGIPSIECEKNYHILKTSVNSVRLNNNPVKLDEDTIDMLYHQIFSQGENEWKSGNLLMY